MIESVGNISIKEDPRNLSSRPPGQTLGFRALIKCFRCSLLYASFLKEYDIWNQYTEFYQTVTTSNRKTTKNFR